LTQLDIEELLVQNVPDAPQHAEFPLHESCIAVKFKELIPLQAFTPLHDELPTYNESPIALAQALDLPQLKEPIRLFPVEFQMKQKKLVYM
jgi:hypothetical protein